MFLDHQAKVITSELLYKRECWVGLYYCFLSISTILSNSRENLRYLLQYLVCDLYNGFVSLTKILYHFFSKTHENTEDYPYLCSLILTRNIYFKDYFG